jgi:hypothetical protein
MPRRGAISIFSIAIAGLLTAAATLAGLCPVLAENSTISLRRAAERTNFSNEEIKDGLFKTAFRAELQFGRHEERIRKLTDPFAFLSRITARAFGRTTLPRLSKIYALGSIILTWL